MTDKPPTTDPEQQRADNIASRRQSGLDPLPESDDTTGSGDTAADREADRTGSEAQNEPKESRRTES